MAKVGKVGKVGKIKSRIRPSSKVMVFAKSKRFMHMQTHYALSSLFMPFPMPV